MSLQLATFRSIKNTYQCIWLRTFHYWSHNHIEIQKTNTGQIVGLQKHSASLRLQFLHERAELLATKMHTTEEKALKAIIRAEQSRQLFSSLNEIFGKPNTPLTQVDVLSDPYDSTSPHETVSCKEVSEDQILARNRKYSLQSLSTPVSCTQTSVRPPLSKPLTWQINGRISDESYFSVPENCGLILYKENLLQKYHFRSHVMITINFFAKNRNVPVHHHPVDNLDITKLYLNA